VYEAKRGQADGTGLPTLFITRPEERPSASPDLFDQEI